MIRHVHNKASSAGGLTVTREVEEGRKVSQIPALVPRVGQLGVRVANLVEEGMYHGINGSKSLRRGVLEQSRDQVNGIGVRFTEDLVERMGLDLWELVLHVVRVHGPNLITGWRSQDLDNFHQLVDARLSREQRLAKHQLGHDAASRPNV